MANEVLVGLKIGAAVSGTLHAAFGSARSTVQSLGRTTDLLRGKQAELGRSMAAALATGAGGVGNLRRQYDQVGRTLDQLKLKQDRLNTSIARGETLKNQRAELRGQAMETAGTALALGAPVVQSVRTAMDFQDQTRDIAITGGFDAAEEKRLSDVLRGSALKWNQTQAEVAKGAQVLIAGGIADAKELAAYAPVLAKTATATRASMDDLGAVAISMNDSLGIGAGGLDRAMNMLAYAGKRGQFELADMAKWLPQLAPQFAALGITGERAVAEIGASLQIARRGAGSNDEAANNFKNFLAKITAPDTIKSFKDAGIDLQTSMRNLVSGGMTPMQAMLEIITKYMGTKSPAAAGEMQKALALKDDQEREAALQRLSEAYKLGDLFRDMQVMSFLRPALANRTDLADIQKGSMGAADQGVNDQDWKKRMGSSREQLKSLMVNLTDIGISIGGALLPAIVDVTKALVPMAQQFGAWAEANPMVIKGVVGLVGGLLAGKLAFIGLRYGINLVLSPFNALTTTITTVSSKWTLLRALWQAGKFVPLITGLGRVGSGLMTVLKYSGLFLRGFSMAFGAPLMLAARGGLMLGRILGGSLLTGLRLAGQAVLWLGRALMLNPIGLAITAIALAAYLIYRYWEPIKGFFSGLWSEIKAGFDGGLVGIAELIINFSPLGLFYRAFAPVLGYFGIELPGKFSEFGVMLVTGLINGIRSMAGSAKDAVVGVGESIKGWFTETLGINSPSRVFIGYGANLSEGAAIGITSRADLVRKAALGMAAGTAVAMAPPSLATPGITTGGPAAGAMTITFAPEIHVQGGGNVQGDVQKALQISYAEFERLMRQYQARTARRSYGEGN
ncbi:phage tail tape measure protein [Pseudomonas nicosulfuronedens]|uniref:phage tail tape measure protein n=1 Tax=Pseudomonas nicosulfuronedens TaxID=2571105 RepID=UPI002448E6A0|nr:phage tail tape measure protein [Pseudomonas nicosulfuronedens]MDH1007430.1 phage tail tape measure protein [Pseudomonas nicosulfuronedens]MDH1977476.1 phage tail tape measure protein [Pseudomonas nicosulfuronedens]MDH2028998.1 phage tail tape measure protein [Pseudomonas nicosulfuronedens]